MAGTGYRPEGHIWTEFRIGWVTWKTAEDVPSEDTRWLCKNCAEVAAVQHQDTDCIDDM